MRSRSHTLLSMFVTGTSELRRNQDNGSSTGSHIYAVDHLVTWSVGAEHGQYVSLKLLRVGWQSTICGRHCQSWNTFDMKVSLGEQGLPVVTLSEAQVWTSLLHDGRVNCVMSSFWIATIICNLLPYTQNFQIIKSFLRFLFLRWINFSLKHYKKIV